MLERTRVDALCGFQFSLCQDSIHTEAAVWETRVVVGLRLHKIQVVHLPENNSSSPDQILTIFSTRCNGTIEYPSETLLHSTPGICTLKVLH